MERIDIPETTDRVERYSALAPQVRELLKEERDSIAAMANMAAVTQRFGASHQAFIIVPLVSAFFIDLANAMLIPFFLGRF